jgi:hypothetical protein
VCPACLATYTKLFSLVGVGFGIDEREHAALLIVAVSVSVSVSAWRSYRSQRGWPLVVALAGAALILAGHLFGDLHVIEWAGVGVLLIGSLSEQRRLRRSAVASLS